MPNVRETIQSNGFTRTLCLVLSSLEKVLGAGSNLMSTTITVDSRSFAVQKSDSVPLISFRAGLKLATCSTGYATLSSPAMIFDRSE